MKSLYFVVILLCLSACNRYGYVKFDYPVEPLVKLSPNIKKIALVQRSLVADEKAKKKNIEAIATAEIIGSDKLASIEALKGVIDYNFRIGQPLFEFILPSNPNLFGTGTREIPVQLDWRVVKEICDANKSDALMVLESFDSNTDLITATLTKEVDVILNGGTLKSGLPTKIKMNLFTYWKIYDPIGKTIIYQSEYQTNQVFAGTGNTLSLPPDDALSKVAFSSGTEYVQRFLPTYYTVKRDLYKRGKGRLKGKFLLAFRKAEMANWEGAIEAWQEILQLSKQKNAGRACLNIAVAHEVLGNRQEAIKWAKKSYEDYGDKLGRNYANILMNSQ